MIKQRGVSVLGQETLESIAYLLSCECKASYNLVDMSVTEIDDLASELRQQTLDDDRAIVLSKFKRRFPNSTDVMYKGHVFHGQYQIHDRVGKKFAYMQLSDTSDILMKLWEVNIIKPLKFTPSVSGAAFLGLNVATHKNLEPNHSNAAHWEWQVVIDVQYELTLNEILEDNGLHTTEAPGVYRKHCLNTKDEIVFTGSCSETWKWLHDRELIDSGKKKDLQSEIMKWMILDSVAGSHPIPGSKHDRLDYESAEKQRMRITSMADEDEIRRVSSEVLSEIAESRLDLLGYDYGDDEPEIDGREVDVNTTGFSRW